MKGIQIVSKVDGFRRGGIAHSTKPTDHPLSKFTKEQLQQLDGEPNLIITEVDIDAPPKSSGVRLDKMSKEELVEYAKATFTLDLAPELSKQQMIAAIEEATAKAKA